MNAGPLFSTGRAALRGAATGLLLAILVQVGHISWGNNLEAVIPGRAYRCAQLSGDELRHVIRQRGIRTVINLRGICDGQPWYMDEAQATHDTNVSLEDIGFSAGRLPPVDELRYLITVLDRSDSPVLIHCRQGIDRTGLVSALVLLLYTDISLNEARRQLATFHGHVALGRTTAMLRFFTLYEHWLQDQRIGHSREAFRRWAYDEYCPGVCRSHIECLDGDRPVPAGKPWCVRVRAHNTSTDTWQLRPGSTTGVHVGYSLKDSAGGMVYQGKAGLFTADVPPGESIDVTLSLPSVPAGNYFLMVDMIDEPQQCWFYQDGSCPLEQTMVVK